MSTHFILFVLCLLASSTVDAKRSLKILINSPAVGYRHIAFHGQLADLLVDAGHEVHFYIPAWEAKEKRNGTRKAHRVVRYAAPVDPEQKAEKRNVDDHELNRNPFETRETGNGDNSDEFVGALVAFCKMQLTDLDYLNSIIAEKFDVAIAEQIDVCGFCFFHAAGISTTLTTSTMISAFGQLARAYGLESPHSYTTGGMCFSSVQLPNLRFAERWRNIYGTLTVCRVFENCATKIQSLFSEHLGRPISEFNELLGNTVYAFVNSAEALEHARSITRKIKPIGGFSLNLIAVIPLSPELERFYAKSKRGVVLLSFGSNIESNLMRPTRKAEMLRAMGQFPDFQFIWRINADAETAEMIRKVSNVNPLPWFDQRAILADERTQLFISHCGANSVLEAAFEGVPVVAVPFFNDQFSNSALLLSRRTAVLLNRDDLNERNLVQALERTLNDPSFLQNARALKARLRAYPDDPRELFVKFVEYAAPFDHRDLDLPSQRLSFVVLHNLDIYGLILSVSLIAVLSVVWISRKVYSLASQT